MKKGIFRRIAGIAISASMLFGMTGIIPANAETAPDAFHDDWLHVENGKVVDMNGNEVWMTGCNWFGYSVGSQVFDGVWSRNMHEMLNEIADHGFNMLRIPMSTQILLQWKNNEPDPADTPKVNEWKNPELTIEGKVGGTPKYSFDIWNQAVEWCRENGIKIMMDIHCATTNASGHNYALWYDDNYSTDDWLEALSWFADYYKDDDTVIAIDLKNEPHGKHDDGIFAKWDGSTDENNWKYAAERGAAAVLEKNPNLLILVEGIETYPKFEEGATWDSPTIDYARYPYSYYYGAWWGGNFRGAREFPIDLGEYQSQLIYSPHDYGPEVYNQEWFYLDDDTKTFDRQSLLDDYWYDSWAYLVEEDIAPLLMGEWGGWVDEEHDKTGENRHWLQELRDYMIDKHINHTFWCFNENSSDTGGLVYDNFEKWDEVKYEFIKPALWQTEDGKFISLDHTIPIGVNGITLNEYYSGSSSTTPTEAAPIETASIEETTDTTEIESITTETTEAKQPLYGDVNANGEVDAVDVLLLNKVLLGVATLSDEKRTNADVDRNGKLEDADAMNILRYLVSLVKELPI